MNGADGLTTTCIQCGDHQSGDSSGKCFDCRMAEPGYRARQAAALREFLIEDNKRLAQMGLQPQRPPQADPGPYRFFWADVIRVACPECEIPTGVGFDRHDPGGEDREPARCTECAADRIEWAVKQEGRALGFPLNELGPCGQCRESTHRYGPGGKPLCPSCEPEPDRAPESEVTKREFEATA